MAKKTKKLRKNAPKTQAFVAAGSSFLGLPAEVRNMIYRLLLVADKPLGSEAGNEVGRLAWAEFGEYHLQPAILRTCRQVHQEAMLILNGENTIGIQIYGSEIEEDSEFESEYGFNFGFSDDSNDGFNDGFNDEAEPITLFMNFDLEMGTGYSGSCIPSIKRFQRVEIVIDTANLDLGDVRYEVESLCSTLCKMPALQRVSLHLFEVTSHNKSHPFLGPFGTLRNLRSAVIHGVPLPFAERLKELMLGNTPQVNVKEMYRSLEKFVEGPKFSISDLEKASRALKELDFQKFNEIRSRILYEGQRRMKHALHHICDSDPKSKSKSKSELHCDSDPKDKSKFPRQATLDEYLLPISRPPGL